MRPYEQSVMMEEFPTLPLSAWTRSLHALYCNGTHTSTPFLLLSLAQELLIHLQTGTETGCNKQRGLQTAISTSLLTLQTSFWMEG
ncbi:hypothetical protein NQZ68_024703 [Dissostichus eleginoides]|nr:hypothetical protein NQZ68_024703 [Dissostichus eleginoides]